MANSFAQYERDIFGPMLVGLVITAVIGGITVVQAVTYIRTSKRDSLSHKLVVYFLLILDTLHLCLFTHSTYHHLVSNPGDPSVIWSFPSFMLIHNILMPIVQSFYVVRIWKLTPRGRMYIPMFLIMLLLATFAFGMWMSCIVLQTKTLAVTIDTSLNNVKAFFVTRVCLDLLLAGTMIFTLARANTNLSWTDSSLTMLLAYLLNTGVIPSLLSIMVFVSFVVTPETFSFLAIEEVMTKLYFNSFLGMLNARYYLQSSSPLPTTTKLFQSTAISHAGRVNGRQPQEPAKTINEVGLPLFQINTRKDEVSS
ncbi:hypothetical protein BDZ94DRAFT_1310855 [Collybia nuda]|uniref:DUF6534 domain-containing protein n=1 Tax=Collybia nuda TaxID=64659 RepID=A0A9P5Y2I6_9AGAR|nr:hypothetical protein BDZ94DRAFT_1310855 [Collybia nuda]